ncbi:ankyrin repeat domain-containing protein [Candidatus Berkiella aquae]|uniref:Ankyrin repeat domain-containing protein n=1 Tax=Candidatus Berkiella aquae TaxID=295108 RepID=A0A0Q9YUG1_9GAMM|nr:ankyrin repeat domain-containing protein [Candidatus Berkiella aquae]MCS5712213.1 ankyrin repeat domain-containing protein [Candidatus Berkiella aquae]
MLYGAKDLQPQIQEAFTEFFNNAITERKVTTAAVKKLLLDLESMARTVENPSQLTFNVKCIINGKKVYSIQTLLQSLKLNALEQALSELAGKYGISFAKQPLINKSQLPTRFTQVGKVLFDEDSGEQYNETLALQGRGQAGLANFYMGPDGKERLIKEDDVATCLMEGTAYYIRDMGILPGNLGSSVNFATVGTLIKEGSQSPSVVSIQDRVIGSEGSKARPWDELVYGIKRNPKTLLSFEGWYPQAIIDNISFLNTQPKWQLAAGIMGSAIAGDESLHVGQFMAIVDKNGHIEGIKRIDLGARERFAVARVNSKTTMPDPYHASKYYQASGQYGKDYVSYLLAEPTLNKMYTMLWMNLSLTPNLEKQIIQGSKEAFIQQFNAIPEQLREQALKEVLATINKSAKVPVVLQSSTLEKQAEELAELIADMDARRVTSMVGAGKKAYLNYVETMNSHISAHFSSDMRDFCHNLLELQQKLITSKDFDSEMMHVALSQIEKLNVIVKELVKEVNQAPNDTTLFNQIQLLTELGSDLVHATTLNLQYRPDFALVSNGPLNHYLDKLQTVNDAAIYCLQTRSKDKVPHVAKIMAMALHDDDEVLKSHIQNPHLIDTLKTHGESLTLKTHTKGELLLLNIFKRYHLNDKLVSMTRQQRDLIADIQVGNFEKVANDFGKKLLRFYDAVSFDEQGKTALHYLMELGGADAHSKKAICAILKSSLGTAKLLDANLNIPDADGLTPLDYLMANPHAPAIVKAIADAYIERYPYGGQFKVEDFFDMENHDVAYQDKVKIAEPQQPKASGWWFS